MGVRQVFTRRQRLNDADRAEALHRALSAHVGKEPSAETAELVDVARLVRPAEHPSERARSELLARLLRAHDVEPGEQRADAGSLDGGSAACQPTVIQGPGVGTVVLADIEHIDPERARDVASRISSLLAHQDDRR